MVKAKQNDSEPNFEANFIKFAQEIFSQRRKTIVNNLNGKYGLNKEKIIDIFNENNLNINLRAESLNTEEIIKLYKIIFGNIN